MVPWKAARVFMLDDAQIPLAILLAAIGSPICHAAQTAIRWDTERIIRAEWRGALERANVWEVIHHMLYLEVKQA